MCACVRVCLFVCVCARECAVFGFPPFDYTLKCCFQLETYLSLKGSNEFWIGCRSTSVSLELVTGCGGGNDGGSNKKSNVARSTWKCSLLVPSNIRNEKWNRIKCSDFFFFFQFSSIFGVAFRLKEEFRCFCFIFYWRIYFLILSDCRRYVKNALFKFSW